MRAVGGAALSSTRAEMGTPSARASAESVEIVGDFVPRSTSEIIEEETPLLDPSARSVSPNCSRLFLIAWATCTVILSAIVAN